MNSLKELRQRLGVTQAELALPLGVTQGNVSLYEAGQAIPQPVAKRLIAFARTKGHAITYEDVYGELPPIATPKRSKKAG